MELSFADAKSVKSVVEKIIILIIPISFNFHFFLGLLLIPFPPSISSIFFIFYFSLKLPMMVCTPGSWAVVLVMVKVTNL